MLLKKHAHFLLPVLIGISSSHTFAQTQGAQTQLNNNGGMPKEYASTENISVDEVVIIGSRLDLVSSEIGSAKTILTKEDIVATGAAYVSDVLRHVPGLAVNRTGPAGGLTQVRIRGSESNHVLVLINGVEANSSNGEFDFSSLTTDSVERIEILRGAQSGLYGSNATAGVINIVTGNSADKKIRLSVETGSLDFDKQSLQLQGGKEEINGSLSVSHQTFAYNASEFGNEKDKDENLSAFVQGQWHLTDNISINGSSRYLFKESDTDQQDFGFGPAAGLAIDSAGFTKTVEKAYALAGSWRLLSNTWVITLSYDSSDFTNRGSSFSNTVADYGDEGGREKIALISNIKMPQNSFLEHELSLAYEKETESYRNTFPFDASQVPEQERKLNSAVVEYFVSLGEALDLSAAYRHDNNDAFENASTYRITSVYNFSDSGNIHGSLGTGVTNPSFFEQFGFVPGTYVGNPNLEPEQQKSWDLGWQQSWVEQRWQTDITYFNSKLENEIAGFTTPINLTTDSDRHGVELSVSWQSLQGHVVSASYTHTNSSEDGQQELRRPETTASIDSRFYWLNNKLNFNLGVIYNGDMLDTDFSTFTTASVESYSLVNASVNYQFLDQGKIFLRVNNLLDEDYQEVIGFATPGVYGSAGLQFDF